MRPTAKETAADRLEVAARLMTSFADRTGLTGAAPARRYLWTDAFAVCNFLDLARRTDEPRYRELALRLVDDVHRVLGRHRPDDARAGWISGLAGADAEAHPTLGGLRIGKPLPERAPDEAMDPEREWDRDGQYFHYLTRWVHALSQAARATRRADLALWATELVGAARRAFVHVPPGGSRRRLHWKMSIDLTRSLVASTGQHDALDGHAAALEAAASRARLHGEIPAVPEEAFDFLAMIDRRALTTLDPLGIGALLTDAHLLEQLAEQGMPLAPSLVDELLDAAADGLARYLRRGGLRGGTANRLAFREAGLAIGLEAAAIMRGGASSRAGSRRRALLDVLAEHHPLAEEIVSFWVARIGRLGDAHRDIDEVMLATALSPHGYLVISGNGDHGRAARPVHEHGP